jgi:aspartate dehydrogenase
MKKNVGLIGFGVIGKYMYEGINKEKDVEVGFVYDLSKEATAGLPNKLVFDSAENLESYLLKNHVDLVCEMATFQAAKALVPTILKYSDIVIFSTTVFADQGFMALIEELCKKYNRKVYIPHGAILGLDGIRDGREKLKSVTITTIKKPVNLGCDSSERRTLFEGSTRMACQEYPRNVNVHAGVAIAGLGFDKTRSRIIADPDIAGNTHLIEIEAEGVSFKLEICSEPKGLVTGAYTPVSALNTVKRIIANNGLTVI